MLISLDLFYYDYNPSLTKIFLYILFLFLGELKVQRNLPNFDSAHFN